MIYSLGIEFFITRVFSFSTGRCHSTVLLLAYIMTRSLLWFLSFLLFMCLFSLTALKILSVFGLVYNILNIMCLSIVVVVAVVCMCVSVYPALWAFWICGLVSASNFEKFRLLSFSNISQTLFFFFSFWGSSCISLRLFVWYCPTAVGFSGFFFLFSPLFVSIFSILPI